MPIRDKRITKRECPRLCGLIYRVEQMLKRRGMPKNSLMKVLKCRTRQEVYHILDGKRNISYDRGKLLEDWLKKREAKE